MGQLVRYTRDFAPRTFKFVAILKIGPQLNLLFLIAPTPNGESLVTNNI
jgi:hypothetical protein